MRESHPGATVHTQQEMIEDKQARVHAARQLFRELQRRERRKKKKKKHRDDDDDDEDDDEMYHPSQDYNDDSQVDPEFRPTRREHREADEEGDSSKKGQVKAVRLYICKYVGQCTYVWFYERIFRKCILYPRTLCLTIYS